MSAGSVSGSGTTVFGRLMTSTSPASRRSSQAMTSWYAWAGVRRWPSGTTPSTAASAMGSRGASARQQLAANCRPRDRLRLLGHQAYMDRQVADLGQNAQGKGKLVISAVHDLAATNGHVAAAMRGQQLRQQQPKGLVLLVPLAARRGRKFNDRGRQSDRFA